jgi:hypothetical protein
MSRLASIGLVLVACLSVSGCTHGERASPRETDQVSERPSPFVALHARPLRLPRMPPGTCRMTPSLSPATSDVPGIHPYGEAALGDGPVYAGFRGIPRLFQAFPAAKSGLAPSTWRTGDTVWISAPRYRGAVLVRGRRIDGKGTIGFGRSARPPLELRLPAGRWNAPPDILRRWPRAARNGWRFALDQTRFRADGCYAFQIDGKSFSEVIVFGAKLQP